MSKKYQVFMSSTYEDLVEERKEVNRAILECGCFPSGMELFPASNDNQWDVIKRIIDDCDYFLLVIAGNYGSLGTDDEGNKKSYTEMEFDYAIKKGKPVIAFLRNTVAQKDDVANTQNLEDFRDKVQKDRIVSKWGNKDELRSEILKSLPKLIEENPAQGWIRPNQPGDITGDSEKLSVSLKHSGIINIHNDNKLSQSVLEKKLAQLVNEPSGNRKKIRTLAYYGDVFLRNLKTYITEAIDNGVDIQMLIAKEKSNFIREVWDLEVGNPRNKKTKPALDKAEQDRAMYMIDDIEKYAEGKAGSFACRIYNTQIRYALIAINEEWAWWTPYHPGIEVKDTTSFELIRSTNMSIIMQCIQHFDLLWEKSSRRKNHV